MKTMLQTFYLYSSIRVRCKLLCINQIKYIKTIIWDREKTLFSSIFKDWKLQPLQADTPQTWSRLLLTFLQVYIPNAFSHNQLDHFNGREWIVWEKRTREGMLRQELKEGCKYLGKEGKGFG
jgi:hypothetical protein